MVLVERSHPAPKSLAIEARKQNGKYNKADVVERLRRDFHDKCYICELKGLQDPEVEHLVPHENGRYHARKFDWNNLFWSCGHCNSVKSKAVYSEGVLDCCRQDPEQAIRFAIEGNNVNITAFDPGDSEAMKTAQLATAVYTQNNTGIRTVACKLRMDGLWLQMRILYSSLRKYRKNPTRLHRRTVEALLARESAFAAFKRCYVREHLAEYPDLVELVALETVNGDAAQCDAVSASNPK